MALHGLSTTTPSTTWTEKAPPPALNGWVSLAEQRWVSSAERHRNYFPLCFHPILLAILLAIHGHLRPQFFSSSLGAGSTSGSGVWADTIVPPARIRPRCKGHRLGLRSRLGWEPSMSALFVWHRETSTRWPEANWTSERFAGAPLAGGLKREPSNQPRTKTIGPDEVPRHKSFPKESCNRSRGGPRSGYLRGSLDSAGRQTSADQTTCRGTRERPRAATRYPDAAG